LSIHPQAKLHPIAELQPRVCKGCHQLGALAFDQHAQVCCVQPELAE
jgi:hypothetical protein